MRDRLVFCRALERCVAHLGVQAEYVNMREITGGVYDTYCAGELYAALLRK